MARMALLVAGMLLAVYAQGPAAVDSRGTGPRVAAGGRPLSNRAARRAGARGYRWNGPEDERFD